MADTIEYLGMTYTGEVKKGKPHGEGTYVAPACGKEYDSRKYFGEWNAGWPHGHGVWVYPDKTKYVGEFKNGKFKYSAAL